MNRQKLLLTLLVGIFALALAYAFWATPRQQRAPEAGGRAAEKARATPAGSAETAAENRLHLELLDRQKEPFPGFRRDIFRFRQPAPKPRPPVVKAPAPPPPPPPPPIPAAEEVQRELASFTFLGYLEKGGEKTIFLSSKGELFLVRKGDRFGPEKRFIVTDLTPEWLTIRQEEDPRPITIPLVEQAPLVPSRMPGGVSSPSQRGPLLRPPVIRPGPFRPRGNIGIRQPERSAPTTQEEALPLEQPFPAEEAAPSEQGEIQQEEAAPVEQPSEK